MAKTETAPNKESSPKRRQLSGWQAQLVAVLCIAGMLSSTYSSFLYFQF